MKLIRILSCATALLVLASPAAFAAKAKAGKGDPAKKAARQAARAAAQYDKNGDGSITDESTELRKAFEADKTGPLKAFDLNADGTLDDSEIAAIKIGKHAGKGAAKAGKAGKKKKDTV
jgi:EF hand